jgi:hypothetical protein
MRLDPAVEPDRRVERDHLMEEQMGQLGLEDLAVLVGREVAAFAAPLRRRLRHAIEQLTHRMLALGASQRAAEVLLRDHVGRQLRPELRHLDVSLLESDLARARRDHRVAQLPLDLVVRVHARFREAPPEPHPLTGTRRRRRRLAHLPGNLDRALVLFGSLSALKHRLRPPGNVLTRRQVGDAALFSRPAWRVSSHPIATPRITPSARL